MITPAYAPTATERVLPRLALDFTTAVADPRVATARAANTATRFNSSGIIEIVNADLPRFDFSPTTIVCLGQLIEEARTNLFLNSLIDGTNLATQSVTLTAVAYTLSFYGSGTVTISGGHSATVAGVGDFPGRKTYTFTPTAGSSTFTVSGDVNFAQLEAGSFATSFIPTAASSVTRNADVVSMTGTNFSDWYNASEGTFVAGYDVIAATTTNVKPVFAAYDGTFNSNRVYVNVGVSGQPIAVISSGGSAQANIINSAISANVSAKSAIKYKDNDFALGTNAAAVVTDTLGVVPVGSDRLDIGRFQPASVYLNGHINFLDYYPLALTNNEVRAFSK
jgi:hypothetical protein